jgi:hypothetical protein
MRGCGSVARPDLVSANGAAPTDVGLRTLQLSRFLGRTEVRIAISRTAMTGEGESVRYRCIADTRNGRSMARFLF